MPEQRITAKNIKAMKCVALHPGIRPSGFAEKMYPESSKRIGRVGRGVARGVGARQAAGSVLARLRRRGLVRLRRLTFRDMSYEITERGTEILIERCGPDWKEADDPLGTACD